MQHYIFAMQAGAPAPAGHGDTKSWFEFYKKDAGDHVFVPFPAGSIEEDKLPGVGDKLWFAMDGFLTGVANITEVFTSCLSRTHVEVYYNSDKIVPVSVESQAAVKWGLVQVATGLVSNPRMAAWLNDLLQGMAIDR